MSSRTRKSIINVLTILLIGTVILTGCWDQREIQERGLVMAVGIDVADEGTSANSIPPYVMSVQILKLAATSDKQSAKEAKTYVLTGQGESLFEIARQLYSKSSKTLWFEHLQAIIITKRAIEKRGLKPVLDFFIRDAEMRWKIRVYTVKDNMQPFLEFQPPSGEAGGIFLNKLLRQHARDPEIPGKHVDLGYINRWIDLKNEALIPELIMENNKIKISGADVFRKNKYLGHVDGYAIKGLKFIRGTIESAVIPVRYPAENDSIIAYEVFNIVTKLEPHVNNNEIYFTLELVLRGNVGEKQIGQELDFDDPKQLADFENAVNEEIKKNVIYGLNQARRLKVDYVLFSDKLRAYYPETWQVLKKKWQEIFPTIPLYVRVRINIHHRGEHL